VVLGDRRPEAFPVRDFAAYIRHARWRVEHFVQTPPANSYPEPCTRCAHCHWQERCTRQWEEEDHLSRVANMRRTQADKLKREGIKTLEGV
jgi:uncharacterized protein